MAKAQSSQLMVCLVENERRLALFSQENERLRREYESRANENVDENTPSPDAEEEQQEQPTCSKKDKKSNEVKDEPKRSAPSCSEKEPKSHSHGAEEKEQKKMVDSSSKKESKSHSHGAEQEQNRMLSSFSKRTKKEHKMSHGAEEKELKKIKKDSSMDKELKTGHAHAKTYGVICFDPMAMLPIPGISSKHKEAGDSNDEHDNNLTDSIFDLVESPPRPHRHRRHRRTTSSVDDEKSISSEEFEHEKRPHLDDMEVERAGPHSTKKGVLLKKFGDLWKRKNQGHGQNHHNTQYHNLHHKEVTT